MATVEDSIRLRDGFSPVLANIRTNARSASQVLKDFRAEVESPISSDMFNQMTTRVNSLEEELRQTQHQLNQVGEQGRKGMNGVSQGANMAVVNVAALIQILAQANELFKKFTDTADMMTSITARVKLINDGNQTDQQLDQMIFQSAQRARASYEDTAAAISKMGLLAGEAFSGNDEMVYFAELMNKTFKVGGSSIMEQQAAMYQLTQAMAAGKFQGDEFRSIMENAPMLAQAIADVTGKTKGELKEMSADGVITSDIIKAAMFSAADDIESKFAQMPVTFGERMRTMKNDALYALKPALEEFSAWVNSNDAERFFNNMKNVIVSCADAALDFVETLANGANWVEDNWGTVEPVMWGLVAAIGAAEIAQWALNIAIYANPYNWIVLGIGLVVGALVALGVAIYRNWNLILDGVDQVKIGFAVAGSFIQSVMETLALGVIGQFEKMVNGAIDMINLLIAEVNTIPGVAIDTIDNVTWQAESKVKIEADRQQREQNIEQMRLNAAMASTYRKYMSAPEKWGMGGGEDKSLIDLFKDRDYTISNIDKVGSVGKIDDDVKISNEDMKIMRELAEVQAIQKFVTYSPNIKIETGDINEKVDIDDLVDAIYYREEIEYEAVMAF